MAGAAAVCKVLPFRQKQSIDFGHFDFKLGMVFALSSLYSEEATVFIMIDNTSN